MKKKVRVSVKALIVEEGQILCNKYQKNGHVYYGLPGGGQNLGEPLPIALKRECLEEISTEVEVGRLRFVRDYIAQNHEFAKEGDDFHQLELMFECRLLGERVLSPGIEPDGGQIGVEWLPLSDLPKATFYPKEMKSYLLAEDATSSVVYLGDVN